MCLHTMAQRLAARAGIIVAADRGTGGRETAATLRIRHSPVHRWRRRWRELAGLALTARLSDDPRAGTPPTVIPEQICAIIALAGKPALGDGVELARWTQADLTEEAAVRGIVESISADSVGGFLREVDLKPHRVQGWINTPRGGDFEERCRDVCETYRLAPARAVEGIETRRMRFKLMARTTRNGIVGRCVRGVRNAC